MRNNFKNLIIVILCSIPGLTLVAQYGAPDPNSVGTGNGNTVVGTFAGNSLMTATNNSIFGTNSGFQISLGSDNSIFGAQAGANLKEGFGNTFVGVGSGSNNNGTQNSFLGRSAGESNISGSKNSFFGESACSTLTGSNNICIGSFSGPETTLSSNSNLLFIDIEQSNNPLIYGEFDNDFIRINGTFEVTAGLSNPSDVNLKTNFEKIDENQILNKVSKLNIQEWNYIAYPNNKHIGPTAQGFYNLFKLGADNKHISTIDASGIALASIKALKSENDAIKSKMIEQEILINELIYRIQAIEEKR